MTSNKRIAHLTTVDLSLRYLVLPQLEAPLRLGIESLGISSPGPWVQELEDRGIRHLSLPTSTRGMSLRGDLKAAFDLFRLLRRHRPTILHTHNPKPGIYGRIVGRLAGVPIVVNTVHGLYATPDDRLVKKLIVYGLETVAARFSDAELVQSLEDTQLINRLRIAPRSKVLHLGNGIDLSRFEPVEPDDPKRKEAREIFDVRPDQVVVGMVGRLVREKGYPDLLAAAERLDDRFVVVCIGPEDPDKADAIPQAMLERARESGVRFLGMRTDVDRLYSGMDVFVLPSYREGFPRAAMEAAASGLPLVVTDIRGCREVVDHGVNGYLVPVGNPEALATALRSMADPETRERFGKAGRKKAERFFDERRVVDRVLETYLRLARTKGLEDLASSLSSYFEPGETRIRDAAVADAPFVAGLHRTAIQTGFLPRLGTQFMEVLYRAMIEDPEAIVLIAEDDSGLIGFAAGAPSTSAFYRRFARRYAWRAVLAAGFRLVRPSFIRRVIESLRYGTADEAVGAELLSMAVTPDRRGRGLGVGLGTELLERLGSETVRVVVGSENRAAISAYQRMGFRPSGTIEVHRGERSEVLVWSLS